MIRDVHPGYGSRIPILMFYPSRIPVPVTGGQKGTGSRIRNTAIFSQAECTVYPGVECEGERTLIRDFTCSYCYLSRYMIEYGTASICSCPRWFEFRPKNVTDCQCSAMSFFAYLLYLHLHLKNEVLDFLFWGLNASPVALRSFVEDKG